MVIFGKICNINSHWLKYMIKFYTVNQENKVLENEVRIYQNR